jgi:hypothetical protein
VKYDDFALLCDREWASGPPFGDVTALSLTDESAAWLIGDPQAAANASLLLPEVPEGAAGVVRNPVTCSDVTVTGGADSDTATVSYGNFDWSPPPRTVALA